MANSAATEYSERRIRRALGLAPREGEPIWTAHSGRRLRVAKRMMTGVNVRGRKRRGSQRRLCWSCAHPGDTSGTAARSWLGPALRAVWAAHPPAAGCPPCIQHLISAAHAPLPACAAPTSGPHLAHICPFARCFCSPAPFPRRTPRPRALAPLHLAPPSSGAVWDTGVRCCSRASSLLGAGGRGWPRHICAAPSAAANAAERGAGRSGT